MNLAVIMNELSKYGGSEKVVVECLRRWQHKHDITLYSTQINDALLREHGVTDVAYRYLTPYFTGENSLLLNSVTTVRA